MKDGSDCPTLDEGRTGYPVRPLLSVQWNREGKRNALKRTLFEEDHEMFREMAAEFNTRAVAPHYAQWDEDHMMSRELWTAAGEQGLLGLAVPEEFGGMGMVDYRFRAVLDEEFARSNHLAVGLAFHLHDDMVLPHLLAYGSDDLKSRWLPGMVSGENVTSIAWTEPGAGSDLRGIRTKAVRDGDDWLISGQKTFIGNGISGDASLVLARTDGSTGRGNHDSFSLFMVGKGEGYNTGKQLDKMGLKASDTAELFFDNVRVPHADLVGEEGKGLQYAAEQLPQGRLAIAVASSAVVRAIYEATVRYTKDRNAFGERIIDFQNTRFELADILTEVEVTETLRGPGNPGLQRRRARRRLRRPREAVGVRARQVRHRPLPPAARRLRLHPGIPRGAGLPGRPAADHLRRHQRNHARRRRPHHRRLTRPATATARTRGTLLT